MQKKKFWGLVALVLSLTLAAACAPTDERRGTGEYVDDKSLETRVKTALAGDDRVSAIDVEVEVYRGVVSLSGFVDNDDERDAAEEVAANVAGVKEVTNGLSVKKGY